MPNRLTIADALHFLGPFAASAIVVVVVAGCSRQPSSLTRVSGRITYQGKPVSHGVVSFVSLQSNGDGNLPPAAGVLEPDGRYRLSACRDTEGILPGKYAVAVTAYRSPQQMPSQKVEYAVPAKYINPHTSGLTATVPTDVAGALRFDFELGD